MIIKRIVFGLMLVLSTANGQHAALSTPPAETTVEQSAASVPAEFLPAYFSTRPERYLVDPQNLLGGKEFQDRLDFLNYHASDSAIDFYIYIFRGDQEIASEDLTARLFNDGRPAVVVFYFMGAPGRAAFHLSPALSQAIPITEQRRALQSSVMVAMEDVDASSQLDSFAVQMSIRIYWMERLLEKDKQPAVQVMAPVVQKAVIEKHSLEWVKAEAWVLFEKWRGAALVVASIAGLTAVLIWIRMRRAVRFPDLEVEPRLGGAHCAGVGAVISFASSAVTPASQKDQVPEYLRRA